MNGTTNATGTELKPWNTPELQRLDAGSAENGPIRGLPDGNADQGRFVS